MRTSLAAAEVGPQIQGRVVMYGRPAARRHREHVFRARCLVHWCYLLPGFPFGTAHCLSLSLLPAAFRDHYGEIL